jgi:hypothetical protein
MAKKKPAKPKKKVVKRKRRPNRELANDYKHVRDYM